MFQNSNCTPSHLNTGVNEGSLVFLHLKKMWQFNSLATRHLLFVAKLLVIFWLSNKRYVTGVATCADNRKIFTSSSGVISDGSGSYPINTNCEWLIRAPYKNQTITVKFTEFFTECSFDFLYVFDGGSYKSPLLGSFTGQGVPAEITSSSYEMLIHLSSDYYTVKQGFRLAYEASDCPRKCSNAGICNSCKCQCGLNYKGDYCQYLSCPQLCYDSISKGNCDLSEKKCKCTSGNFGDSCSLSSMPNSDPNSWHVLSAQSPVFKPRSRHVAAYHKETDTLWVHGGQSLNDVFDDILMYNITSNSWHDFPGLTTKPTARFHHAGGFYLHYFVIFGGELAAGTASDELWMFNTVTKTWTQPTGHDTNRPNAVAGHTANIVGSKLYIFGGRTSYGGFSTDVFMFDLQSSSGWKKLTMPGGKTSTLRLFGHSSVYNSYTNSLLIFGGELAVSSRKDAVKQKRLLSFCLDHHVWTEVVPNQHTENMLPLGRSFHSAVIAGDYMVMYGGLLDSSITSTICHSNELLYYNIKCNAWVKTSTITSKSPASGLSEPPSQGRLSHVGIMRDYQTMLVVGGYNGSMHGDVLAYKMPRTVVFKNSSDLVEPGQHCGLYDEKNACYDDPACGWCFDNLKCLALQHSHKCSSNFDSRHCTSHCSAYTSCTSCILFGNSSKISCSWCVQDSKCYPSNSPGGRCAADATGLQIGWWGSKSSSLTSVQQCMTDNIPPGITVTEFKDPVNRGFPDGVFLMRSSKLEGTNFDHFKKTYELKGLVYPYVLEADPSKSKRREVYLSGRRSTSGLYLSSDELVSSKKQVANFAYSNDLVTVKATLQNDANLFPVLNKNSRYYMECQVNVSQRSSYQAQVSWNLTSSSAASLEAINASFLHPYVGGICSNHVTCMACMTDAGCGWCTVTASCISRSSWSTCVTVESKASYLVLNSTMCVQCDDYHDCKSCAQNSYCSWKPVQRLCSRNGMHAVEVKSSLSCPSICSSRSNCSSCLADNECRWCEEKESCFPASDHMMRYSIGECFNYKIRDNTGQKTTCRNCSRHSTCGACFADHRCGWCGNVNNPLIGLCREGDFSGPGSGANCSAIMNTNETVTWSYEKCPDVDECRLKLDTCDSNATCFNTYGSYNCICNQGYTGDGRTKCEKTCYPPCQHGTCGADYKCKCDLGWKGINCSIDCGCNGHSTCHTGISICDSCQGNTQGKYCQECVLGAFGNATTSTGCSLCQCNKHGDKSKGICNRQTGKCFCKNHTTGDHCEQCQNGLTGDPRNGGICFHDCTDLSIIKGVSSGILSFKTTPSNCLWVISSSNASNHDTMFGKAKTTNASSITLDFSNLKLSCQDSHVYIYDGVPQGSVSTLSELKLLASVCGYDPDMVRTITGKSGIMTVIFKGPKSKPVGSFVAKFNIYDCPGRCPGNRNCQGDGIDGFQCVCKSGWTGVNCDVMKCPCNCSSHTGQGFCDSKSFRCICLPGFIGQDCNQTTLDGKFIINRLSVVSSEQPKPRYGHTFLHYEKNNTFLLHGGRGLPDSFLYNDAWSFNLDKSLFTEISTRNKQSGRYFHCGVIYKEKMIIYGGITVMGVSNELLTLDLNLYNWTAVKPSSIFPTLFGHSCTLVNNFMFVIGGYSRIDGLNEFSLKINLDNYNWEYLKVTGFPPSGVYGHSAVYDNVGNIFIFGGIAFFKERIQESNRVYSFNIASLNWNYLKPVAKNEPFPLFLHSAVMLEDIVYVTGGYSDLNSKGFNSDLFIWKKQCDSWMKISLKDRKHTQGDPFTAVGAGSSLIASNKSLLLLAGFNGQLTGDLWHIKLPKDLCNVPNSKDECLSNIGCSWCQSDIQPNNGTCYSTDAKIPFPCNFTSNLNTTANHSWAIFPGTPCNTDAIAKKPCSTYGSCVSCLATFPGRSKPNCHWCFTQGCRNLHTACTSQFDLKSISSCLELGCEASSCENCGGTGKCFWTRHYEYQSEQNRNFDQQRGYNWNCFRRSLEKSTSGNITDKAPPHPCPNKCYTFSNCTSCISAEGAEGGSKECFWSQKLNACLPGSRRGVSCISGDCATVFDRTSGCPSTCTNVNTCKQCLASVECGWCAKPTVMGEGVCRLGGLQAPKSGYCSSSEASNANNYTVWASSLCLKENECLNGRHNCKTLEDCIDLVDGFACKCTTGYIRDSTNSSRCIPVCKFGCVHGHCIKPDVCICQFGWTGNNCSVPCHCNGHSNCPNATHADTCLKCHNNTQGPNCNECIPSFVGDPKANQSCTPCAWTCNGRSSICVSSSEAAAIPDYVKRNETLLLKSLKRGPKSIKDAVCINCQGDSEGHKCEKCILGYFEKSGDCTKCLCNGHGQTCHNTTGEGCKCDQNTETGECRKGFDCWRKQCSKCKKNFVGNPIDGRQCFLRMARSSQIAIGIEKHIVGGESMIEPIPANKTFFFTVPPKYTNVDIRFTVDVFQGGLDLFITTENMLFTVDVNYTSGEQLLRFLRSPSRRRREILVNPIANEKFPVITVHSNGDELSRKRRASPYDKPVEPGTNVNASVKSLSLYTEYRKGLFMVSGIQKRVIIGISYKNQDFTKERFYIGVVTRGNDLSPLTAGLLYFRQDLPQIDLFVFFSVFFSVFFLILSLFFLVWKVTQLHNGRRAVIAQQIALDTMASRPFACYSVEIEPNESIQAYKTAHSRLVGLTEENSARRKDFRTLVPMAVESTEDELAAVITMLVQFPENEESPSNIAVCSALIQTTPQHLVSEVCCTGQGGVKTTTRYMNTVNL